MGASPVSKESHCLGVRHIPGTKVPITTVKTLNDGVSPDLGDNARRRHHWVRPISVVLGKDLDSLQRVRKKFTNTLCIPSLVYIKTRRRKLPPALIG